MGRDDPRIVLFPGQRVRAEVVRHRPWGVFVRIIGHEDVPASIDASAMDSPSGSLIALPEERPAIGAEVTAVVQEVRRWSTPPGYVRLTIRAQDLDTFRWACDLCMEPATLSPKGDGVVLEARNAADPRSTTIVAHRACLLGALHADSFERARVALLGVEPDSSQPPPCTNRS